MCGVAGIVNLAPRPPPDPDLLRRMAARLRHRGPDGEGLHAEPEVGLAHTRLSIIDVAGGAQPVANEDETVWVVFNGEIFNYLELRAELIAQGHRFRTRSDTEVIVHLYEQRGLDFVDELNGQFAIGLWDQVRRRLVLARDRVGIRPLFYTRAGGRLLFASEVKALFADPAVERRLSPAALAQIFTYWSALPPATLFDGVFALPPGHLMTVEGGVESIRRYWDWRFPDRDDPPAARPLDDCVEELRALLIDSVRLQLRSDVPVGAYLSGGLDSSLLAGLVERHTRAPLRTFSLAFEDPEFDESAHQRAVAAQLAAEHSEVGCTTAEIGAAFPRAVWHAETTILRTAPAPLLLLSGLVRAHGYKVVLTGEGADEVFAGYDLFREAAVRRFWARRPDSVLRPLLFDRLYPYLRSSPTAARAFAQEFFRQGMDRIDEPFFGHLPRWTTTARAHRFFSADLRAALPGGDPYAAIRALLPAEIGRWEPLARDQYVEAHTLLSGYLLSSQGDRMAMASSIEARFPYLDHRVIELAARLPPRYKLCGLREKLVLKRAARGLVPDSILARTKQPYRAPDSRSFFRAGVPLDYVAELLGPARLTERGYFDARAVALLVEKCRQGKAIGFADNMAFVGMLSTMLVDDLLIRERPQ